MNIVIRKMTMDDLPGALEVERACFGREAWSESSYRATLLLPYAEYFVAEEVMAVSGGRCSDARLHRIVGTLGLRQIAGEGEITNVGVLPSCRGRGISSQMMQAVIESCAASGIHNLTLEVRSGNRPAVALYEKFGFVTEGRRPGFYRNPAEDALIMWRRR